MIPDVAADAGTGSSSRQPEPEPDQSQPDPPSVLGTAWEEAAYAAEQPVAPPQEASGEEEVNVLEDTDFFEYALTLGVDPAVDEDLMWIVREAFGSPLPSSWTEFVDEAGRVYYFHMASGKTSWDHPMDEVFRELISMIKQLRAEPMAEADRVAIVRRHLQEVQRRALQELQVWSGPFPSDEGAYYYNEELKASTWESPITEWQNELTLRHEILTRSVLSRDAGAAGAQLAASPIGSGAAGDDRHDLFDSLRLPLDLVRRESLGGDVPQTPSTSRTFYTARSAASSRSKHSVKSDRSRHREHREHKKDRKKEKERSEARSSYSRMDEALEPSPSPPSVFQAVD
jgi:centrosomal protein CEP164